MERSIGRHRIRSVKKELQTYGVRTVKLTTTLMGSTAIFILFTPAPVAWAQDASSGVSAQPASVATTTDTVQSQGNALNEIVVTAQRRSENLQKVPIAVTVATADQLTAATVNSVQDLKLVTPGVDVQQTTGYVAPFVRGVGTRAFGPGFENPIAIYVDDVYLAAPVSGLFTFNNIAQVEVLKGPQGTLFGRNATGGLIQVRTKDPTTDFTGSVRLSEDNYATTRANAYTAGQIAEGIKADLALQFVTQDNGYGKNVTTGHDTYKINHDISARSKWLIDLGSRTKVRIIGDYSDSSNYNIIYSVIPGTGVPAPYSVPGNLGPYDTALTLDPLLRVKDGGVSLRIDHDLDSVRLTSISAYRMSNYVGRLDIDVAPQLGRSANPNHERDHQFSQELQLQSARGKKVNWVIGAYLFDATSKYDPLEIHLDGVAVVPIPMFPRLITTKSAQNTLSLSGYGQATVEVLSGLKITGGLRYTSERRKLTGSVTTLFNNGSEIVTVGPVDNKLTFKKLTWRLSADYSPSDDVLLYVSYNRGFKSGGFSTANPAFPSYQPEVLDAYEGGVKASMFDRRLRFSSAVFYYRYRNVQIQKLLVGVPAVINGAKETLYGFEMNADARLSSRITGSLGYQYLHGRYDSFPSAVISTPVPGAGAIINTNGNAGGNTVPQTPKSTINASLTYSIPVGAGKIDATGNFYYNSGYFGEPDNVLRQPSYPQIGSTIRYALGTSGLAFSIWGSNLTNEKVATILATNPGAGATGVYRRTLAAPRTYGATVEYRW